ncbi:MAG: hypothetical protein WD669_04715 [Pirellulales bacterium]
MAPKSLHGRRRSTRVAVRVFLLMVFATHFHRSEASDVIVLANRTSTPLALRIHPTAGPLLQLSLAPDDVRPLFVDGPAQVEFAVPGQTKRYQLDPNSAYYFGRDGGGRVDMQKIGLGDENAFVSGRRQPGGLGATATATITVKLLVDEEEPTRQFAWEQRLRRRIDFASEILQRHCRVQLKVVTIGTWDSDDATNDFFTSLAEFEKEVDPAPARVAIGFTSQFQMARGRVHMAGTRGPLHSHILIREGSPKIDEEERREFLVHELGHFLGAAHSPEKASVMRPVLGDNLAGRTGFQIRFDPVNTLVIGMIGEEMRSHKVEKFVDLSSDTKRQLQSIYGALSRALPADASGEQFMRLAAAATNEPLVRGARRVLQSVVHSAVANRALPQGGNQPEGQPSRRSGDELCEYLVRQGAGIADTLPDDVAPSALLLALAIGLDDSDALLTLGQARSIAQAVESPPDRAARLAMLGEPTLRGRRDLARRFFAAAYLAAAIGPDAAKEVCLSQELLNAKRGSFDFALVAADRAGIRWGNEVNRGRFSLPMIAAGFSGSILMPSVDGLPAGLLPAQLTKQFGAADDNRFRQQLSIIEQRVTDLPYYRPSRASFDR